MREEPEDDRAALAERVIRARHRARLTQQQLADAAHVSLKTVNNFETGRHRPQAAHRLAILAALGLDPSPERPEAADRAWPADVNAFVRVIGDHLASLTPEQRGAQFAHWLTHLKD